MKKVQRKINWSEWVLPIRPFLSVYACTNIQYHIGKPSMWHIFIKCVKMSHMISFALRVFHTFDRHWELLGVWVANEGLSFYQSYFDIIRYIKHDKMYRMQREFSPIFFCWQKWIDIVKLAPNKIRHSVHARKSTAYQHKHTYWVKMRPNQNDRINGMSRTNGRNGGVDKSNAIVIRDEWR